jgi:hypothetical protein
MLCEWTPTEASKRQFGVALWPPGMRVLFGCLGTPVFCLAPRSSVFFPGGGFFCFDFAARSSSYFCAGFMPQHMTCEGIS